MRGKKHRLHTGKQKYVVNLAPHSTAKNVECDHKFEIICVIFKKKCALMLIYDFFPHLYKGNFFNFPVNFQYKM